jgi:tetratricopeptide (TPR) repeat protein
MRPTAALAALILAVAASAALADPEDSDTRSARDPDVVAGRQALEAKDWKEAAGRFAKAALRDPGNADLQNYLGYANRHLGRYELAFEHYKRALAIDPRHKGAHEYIGEAYLETGDLASAQRHLATLRNLCPLSCEQLEDLQREVAAFRKNGASAPKR